VKAVILAGGLGTRLSEETAAKPKPMIEIGAKPLLWHIMKIYSAHGIDEFVVCLGYRGYLIKEYFANYYLHMGDVTFDLKDNRMEVHQSGAEPWKVTLIDTGPDTMTGGRLKRVLPYIDGDEFCFTYGDGVADVDIAATIELHRRADMLATMTVVRPSARFGTVAVEGERVTEMLEKHPSGVNQVNGGFFVVEPAVLDRIDGDTSVWERDVLPQLATEGQLAAYQHDGYWQPMDTAWERELLEDQWVTGRAPWKVW
jgi:glucose-1-phosphate cytidylyltransferase